MPKLLVTGVGSNIGQGILKSLAAAGLDGDVVGTDVFQFAAGFAWCQAAYQVPFANAPEYAPRLIDILRRHGTQLVLIGSEAETWELSKLKARLERETSAKIVVNGPELIGRMSDKWGVAELFREAGLNYPKSIIDMGKRRELVAQLGYPLILKPRRGWSARAVQKIEDDESLDFYAKHTPEPILQEYLEGDEFTCAVVFDRDGNYCDHVVMRRDLLSGTTFRAEIVARPDIDEYVVSFARKLRAVASINLQLRVTKRGPVCFEINPRFSGTTAMRMKAGFNDVAAVVRNFLDGTPIGKQPAQRKRILRFWDEVVIEPDDPRFPK
ncbi:MAG: ATP-grasp domain-containing protein [Planctomycetes bacterium]|nr:ATP-grasp domain-containing protein [Planctomycetota bacterium]